MTDFLVETRDKNSWQQPVLDKDLTAPPGGESKGDRYIVGASASGDWSGHENDIAQYNGSGWTFFSPITDWVCLVSDEALIYRYTGAAWETLFSTTIHNLTEKSTLSLSDVFLLEDSEDSWAQKFSDFSALGNLIGLKTKIISTTRDTSIASGNQTITGVGFTPKAAIILVNKNTTHETSVGFSDGSTHGAIHDYYNENSSYGWGQSSSAVFIVQSLNVYYAGVFSSFNSDGGVITWTKYGSKTGTVTFSILFLG